MTNRCINSTNPLKHLSYTKVGLMSLEVNTDLIQSKAFKLFFLEVDTYPLLVNAFAPPLLQKYQRFFV